jgi:hypothetical protein
VQTADITILSLCWFAFGFNYPCRLTFLTDERTSAFRQYFHKKESLILFISSSFWYPVVKHGMSA